MQGCPIPRGTPTKDIRSSSQPSPRRRASRDDVLAYMVFPREHWAQISSINPLQCVNRETKRRSDFVGIFPNGTAIFRLVGALMTETNDE